MTFYLILAYSAFLLSLLGTRLIILTARKKSILLERNSKRKRPIPTGGGIAVVMSLIICLLAVDIHYGIILAMFLLAAVSLLGELIEIHVLVRLLVYLMAVLIPVGVMHDPVFGGFFPLWADKTITVMLWVWFIHVFNQMDGIDGIAPTEMICIATGFALITALDGTFPTPLSVYSLIIMAAGCGFFWWNWYPAKILMGEVGTAPIGYLIGYLLFTAVASGYAFAAAILPAYYICDAGITLIRRLVQGKNIIEPHFQHYYQLAVRMGRRHDSVVRYILGGNLLLIALAVFTVIDREFAYFYLMTAYASVLMIIAFFSYAKHNPRHEPF